jgi:hypothetical protein
MESRDCEYYGVITLYEVGGYGAYGNISGEIA